MSREIPVEMMNTLIWTNVIYNFPVLNEYNKENSWKLFKKPIEML